MSKVDLAHLTRLSVAKVGKWGTGVAFVGSVVSDVLNPLGPFSGYIALLACAAAIVILLGLLIRVVKLETGMPALAFAVISSVVSGGLYSLQKSQDAEAGLIAELVPAVRQVQQSLGIISQKVAVIEETVKENLDVTKDVQATTKDIAKQTTEISLAIDALAEGFKQLGNQGGVIANPERPEQHYHNARIHELGGDTLRARQSYLAFANFNVDAIDPYLRFATFLKVSEGRAGAREVLGALRERNKTPSLELAYLQLAEDGNRLAKLKDFIAKNAAFGPAYYVLADEFSEDRLGIRALADKTAEAEALTKFLSFEADGKLVAYFVDQSVQAEWIERAKSRLAALGDLSKLAAPTINAMRTNAGWQVEIVVAEPALKLFWRYGERGEFADTGQLPTTDPATGQPKANPLVNLPAGAGAGSFFVKYTDLRGRELGPFDVRFEPQSALLASQKTIIEQLSTNWVAVDGRDGKVFFTTLASYSCGISEVRYGLNGAKPDKPFAMPKCNPAEPMAIPSGYMTFAEIGPDVTSVSVEITYADGTVSDVKAFPRN